MNIFNCPSFLQIKWDKTLHGNSEAKKIKLCEGVGSMNTFNGLNQVWSSEIVHPGYLKLYPTPLVMLNDLDFKPLSKSPKFKLTRNVIRLQLTLTQPPAYEALLALQALHWICASCPYSVEAYGE